MCDDDFLYRGKSEGGPGIWPGLPKPLQLRSFAAAAQNLLAYPYVLIKASLRAWFPLQLGRRGLE